MSAEKQEMQRALEDAQWMVKNQRTNCIANVLGIARALLRLKAVVDTAPHDEDCAARYRASDVDNYGHYEFDAIDESKCTCWKAGL